MSLVTWLVDRLHVATPRRDVVAEIRRRIRRDLTTRADRAMLYREALRAHRANRALYDRVMRGRF